MIPPSTFMDYGGGRIMVHELLPNGCYRCSPLLARGRRHRGLELPASLLDAVYSRQNPRAPWATRP